MGTNTNSMLLPKGTTGAEPTAVEGMIRYNTTTHAFEGASGSTPTWGSLAAASGTSTLGTSLTAASPQISGDATSGLYTPASSTVAIVTHGVERMRADASGYVSIGTTTTGTYTLQVNGSIAGTQAYVNTSDARLKKDIVTITDGLATVEKLRGVHFNWRAPEERDIGQGLNLQVGTPQIGFIAQEVEKVLPEAVVIGKDGIHSLEESKMTPVLVEAVKELKADNDDLRKKLAIVAKHEGMTPETMGAVPAAESGRMIWLAFGALFAVMLAGMGGLALMLVRTQRELRKLSRRK
jgi:hypothetical protein